MTSQPSPTYNFPGISYNPSYFTATKVSTGLSIATANGLYLRKTYADTATSLETFSGGISTTDLSLSGNETIAGTLGVTGLLTSNTLTTNSIDTTTAGNLTIGGNNCTGITFSDTVGATTFTGAINTASINSSAVGTDLAIAGLQTAGILQLGTGSTRTSAINVGSATNTGAISLSTLTGAVNIGADQTTGAINIGTSINRINTAGGLGAINIGTGANANAFGINIGNGTATVTIAGPVALTSTSQATTIAGALYLTSTANTNIFSGPLQLNKGLTMGSNATMTLGTVATTSALYYTQYTTANPTFTMTLVGQTAVLYFTANSAAIPQNTDTVLYSITIANTGMYIVSYQTRYSGTGTETSLQTWMDCTSPALATFGLQQISQTTPLNISAGACITSTWTGIINAGATLRALTFFTYSATPYTATMTGGLANSYITVMRIA